MRNMTRKGFTLIELLIVVHGRHFAVIAIPKFEHEGARQFRLDEVDLRNMVTHAGVVLRGLPVHVSRTASNYSGGTALVNGFVPSAGVTVTTTASSSTGWSATPAHS